ncbi:MAG: serine hydrolase domain-containing protein [Chitinophagaceae bacterium]
MNISGSTSELFPQQAKHFSMFIKANVCFIALIIVTVTALAQKPEMLPRSTPEAEGVSSQGIINFLEAAGKSKHELHSFMFLRHGKVIAEGWWKPYRSDLKHSMYSVSKSFTSTAIGFAVNENKLSVHDKVISFFPNELPDTVSPYLSELTVKDLLTMSTGHDPDPTGNTKGSNHTWVKTFLSTPLVYKPGTKFTKGIQRGKLQIGFYCFP